MFRTECYPSVDIRWYDGPVKTLAALLREARVRKGISQKNLAGQAGVSDASLSRIESGKQSPTLDMLARILPHYGLSPDDLRPYLSSQTATPSTAKCAERADSWLPTPAHLPHDPLAAVVQCLQAGPWPEAVSAAVYALLVAVVDDRRSLWEKRFNRAVSELLADAELPSYVGLSGAPLTPEMRAEVEACIRTLAADQWSSLKEKLFPSVTT
jgi:transcriptional regulator with XRE-family HTH domain